MIDNAGHRYEEAGEMKMQKFFHYYLHFYKSINNLN